MTININNEGSTISIALSGRLDTTTAPELEQKYDDVFKENKELIFDFNGLDYISSAGLRVMLLAQKQANKQNLKMKVINVCAEINEIFEMTGFSDILTIE